jgi:hypothetical protein
MIKNILQLKISQVLPSEVVTVEATEDSEGAVE